MHDSSDPLSRTATEIAASVRAGQEHPRVVVSDCLARIAALDSRVGAFRRVRHAAALAEAEEVANRPDLSELPLAGVPVAVKDNLAVRGESGRLGSAAVTGAPAEEDHPVVARLRAAGAVVVGLTHVPELCVFGTTDSVYGITRNPWDLGRTAGGSSGGSAAAVAAGMVPVAVGNDGMGSLRIPAANCGVLGLKPGSGVVPSQLGTDSWNGMSENGPLTTTVDDSRLLMSVLRKVPLPAGDGGGAPLRIAWSVRSPLPWAPVTVAWASAVRTASAALMGAGHEVEEADPPYPWWTGTASLLNWTAGTAVEARGLESRLLTRRTRVHAAIGRKAGPWARRSNQRDQLRGLMEGFFSGHDVLVTAALARRGQSAAAWHRRGWLHNVMANSLVSPLTSPWNLAGWPALSVPFGSLGTGAPCAVQLVGPPGAEDQLLRLAGDLERVRPWVRNAVHDTEEYQD